MTQGNVKIIFEAGLNHNGDPSLAHELVEAAHLSGADAVKFQKRDVNSLATTKMLGQPELRFPSLGNTYKDVRSKLELSKSTYLDIKAHSHDLGLEFMVTPFDKPSLDFLIDVGVDSLKVASHSVANPRLLRQIRETGLPVYMSSGMVTLEELDSAMEVFDGYPSFTLMHCSSEYPTTHEGANLRVLPALRSRYGRDVGFSSHELGDLHTLAAVSLGATCIERHVTVDNDLDGFDHQMSMSVESFKQLVEKVRQLEVALGDGVKRITSTEQLTRDKYRVSMVASRNLEPGEVLTEDMICYKNPGTGIPAIDEPKVLGLRIKNQVEADTLISPDDLQDYN